jgi:hypothetical protein
MLRAPPPLGARHEIGLSAFVRITASHGKADDPSEKLRRVGAPAELCDWATDRGIDALWEECDRGDWLVWLAVVESVPLIALVDAAAACAERAMKAVPKGKKRLRAAIREARALRSPEACKERALACEQKADNPEGATYRTAPPTSYQWAAHSAALVARAAEAVLCAEARREGDRDLEGRARAAGIGVADHIISRGRFDPLCFDPSDEWTILCVDAAASSIRAAVRCLAPQSPNERALEEIDGELSELTFEVLDPVRTGLRAGRAPDTLVRRVAFAPFRSASLREEGDEGKIVLKKRSAMAVAAALLVPFGAGHHYAQHHVTGFVLGFGILVGLFATGAATHMVLAPLLLIGADAFLAPGAVRRFNAGEVMPFGKQLALGVILVASALLLANFLG